MKLSPVQKGFLAASGGIALLTALLAGALDVLGLSHASPELFRVLGQAGIGILIAYIVAVSAAEKSLSDRSGRDEHLNWLGFASGLGACGLAGIGLSIVLAEHRAAGHEDLFDWIGLWWAVSSIAMLGVLVAVQPLTSHSWRTLPSKRGWRVERLRSGASRSRGRAGE